MDNVPFPELLDRLYKLNSLVSLMLAVEMSELSAEKIFNVLWIASDLTEQSIDLCQEMETKLSKGPVNA